MSKSKKIAGTIEAWQNGDLGKDLAHAKKQIKNYKTRLMHP